jgi:hypothetical protein
MVGLSISEAFGGLVDGVEDACDACGSDDLPSGFLFLGAGMSSLSDPNGRNFFFNWYHV